MLTFSCVAANHMGLIDAIERVIRHQIPIANCPKCFTFWSVLFTTSFSGWNMIEALAISFLFAYTASWLELGMGFIDSLFNRLYEKIYSASDTGDTAATDADIEHPESPLSDLPKNN